MYVMFQAEVYFSLLDLLVSASKPVLLVGPPGSGKTSFMQVTHRNVQLINDEIYVI